MKNYYQEAIKLIRTQEFCESLIVKNNLNNWRFMWMNHKEIYGFCDEKNKIIVLSRDFALINNNTEIKDVILHEIAHAKNKQNGRHNSGFYKWCKKIGARPLRYNDTANRPK